MNKGKKMAVLLTVLILAGGCTSANSAAVSKANADLLVSIITLPIKIVGAAVVAAVGAAAGMGMMPGKVVN